MARPRQLVGIRKRVVYALYTPAGPVGPDGEEGWIDICKSQLLANEQSKNWSFELCPLPGRLTQEDGEGGGSLNFFHAVEQGIMGKGQIDVVVDDVIEAVSIYAQVFTLDQDTPEATRVRARRAL